MSRRFSINQLPTGSYGITGSFSGSFIGDGSGLSGITATVAPAGPTTAVQFNDGLNNSGSSDFTFDKTTGMALVTSMSIANIYYPTADGTNQQVIKTDGAGNLEFGYSDTITIQVYNSDSITLQKGTPVHATSSGTVGEVTGIVLADAGNPIRMPATAILNTTLAPGETGEAILTGYIRGVNTAGFVSGEVVYVAVGGGYTQIKPTGSALIQNIGIVTKIDPTNGAGIVYGAGRSNELPNITPNYVWLGNPNSVPTAVSSASLFVDSASFALTASYVTPLQQDVTITGSLLLTSSYIAYPDYIDFNTTGPEVQPSVGRLSWNQDDKTLDLGTGDGDTTLQIGQETVYPLVVNEDSVDLVEGTLVMIDPNQIAQGNRIRVVRAITDGTYPSQYIVGVLTEDIAQTAEGFATWFGKVRNLNIPTLEANGIKPVGEAWAEGDVLYPNPAVAGGLTFTPPQAPNINGTIAVITAINGSNLTMLVRPTLTFTLTELTNVKTQDVEDGSILVKSGSLWVSSKQLTGSYGLTGSLTADTFIGSLTGTASYATIADNAHSASIIADISTDATYYPVLSDGTSGARQLRVDSVLLSYNPSTNTLRTTTFEGDLQGTASYASLALTASYALNSPGGGSTDTGSLLVTASISQNIFTFTKGDSSTFDLVFETGSFVLNSQTSSMSVATASYALSGGDAPFPYTGSAQITGSLDVVGPTTVTYEGVPSLVVYGSGSTDAVFIVSGSTGELFSVTDTLTGDLFTVTDADSNAIFNISSSYDIQLGNPIALSLYTTATASIGTSPTTIYSIPTASYEGAWFEYTIRSGSNARAGNIMSIWSGSAVNFTETTTTDFGDTSGVTLSVLIVGGAMAFTGSATTDGWNLRTIIRSI